MADTDNVPTEEPRKASALSGCLIFSILFIVFTFLGSSIVWNYMDNKKAINSITQETRTPTETVSFDEEKVKSLQHKLNRFAKTVRAGEKSSVTFSKEEINLALNSLDCMKEFKEKLYITEMNSSGIKADIAFDTKGNFSETRYLNGEITIQPEITQGSLFPKISEIKPDTNNPVPESYQKFLPQALFNTYRIDPDIQDVFHKLSTVELTENTMTITSDPRYTPPPASAEAGKDNLYTGLAIFGIIFFIFFSSSVFIWWFRKNLSKEKALKATAEATEYEEELAEHKAAESPPED